MKNFSLKTAYFLIFTLSVLITSCTDDTIDPEAKIITVDQLRQQPGYNWLDIAIDDYTPQDSIINEVKKLYKNENQKFLIFVKPSCNCQGTQKLFPNFIKTLKTAGIPDSNYKILAMSSYKDKHPYQSVITLNSLPTIVLMNSNVPTYSLVDTLNKKMVQEGSVLYSPIETYLLESLKK